MERQAPGTLLAAVHRANGLDIEVRQGDVVLTGAVRRRSDAELIPQIVRHVPGVVEVQADLSWSEAD